MIPLPFITCRHRPQSLGEITNKMNWDLRREWMKMACRGVNPPRPVGWSKQKGSHLDNLSNRHRNCSCRASISGPGISGH